VELLGGSRQPVMGRLAAHLATEWLRDRGGINFWQRPFLFFFWIVKVVSAEKKLNTFVTVCAFSHHYKG